MDIKKYQGVFPAFWACYDKNGDVDLGLTQKMAEFLIGKGVQGFYVTGSSGECVYQNVEERKAQLEAIMEVAKGKVTVISHVAANNTRDSQELAAHAEKMGVDAIATIPPIYFKLPAYAICDYWNDISSAAPDTDYIIYNIPQLTGISLTVPMLNTMLENPKVIGVKNTSMAGYDIRIFKDAGEKVRGKDGFVVFNGPDEQFVSGRIMGADGGIGGTYTMMPELYLKANEYVNAGDFEKAKEVQADICRIIQYIAGGKGWLYSLAKEVLRRREGVDAGEMRKPFPKYKEEDIPRIEETCRMIDAAIAKTK